MSRKIELVDIQVWTQIIVLDAIVPLLFWLFGFEFSLDWTLIFVVVPTVIWHMIVTFVVMITAARRLTGGKSVWIWKD